MKNRFEDSMEQEIFDFIKPKSDEIIVLIGVPMVFLFFCGIALLFGEGRLLLGLLCSIASVVGGIFAIVLCLKSRDRRISQNLELYKNSNVFDEVKSEFKNGWNMNGQVILGETYLFGRHSGGIFRYFEIQQVYQTVHKTNFVTDSRSLTVVISGREKEVTLCSLPVKSKQGDEQAYRLMYIIQSKNPAVRLGYK